MAVETKVATTQIQYGVIDVNRASGFAQIDLDTGPLFSLMQDSIRADCVVAAFQNPVSSDSLQPAVIPFETRRIVFNKSAIGEYGLAVWKKYGEGKFGVEDELILGTEDVMAIAGLLVCTVGLWQRLSSEDIKSLLAPSVEGRERPKTPEARQFVVMYEEYRKQRAEIVTSHSDAGSQKWLDKRIGLIEEKVFSALEKRSK